MMRRSREIPRLLFVILLGVLAGFMLVLVHNQVSVPASDRVKPLYKMWEAWVFFSIVVGFYISYLKQHARMASQHVVDEKIRTHRLIECLPQAMLVTDERQRILAANAAAGRLLGRDSAECLDAELRALAVPEDAALSVLPAGQSRVKAGDRLLNAVVHPVSRERGASGGAVVVLVPRQQEEGDRSQASGAAGLRKALDRLAAAPSDPEATAALILAADRSADRAAPRTSLAPAAVPLGTALDAALAELGPALALRRLAVTRSGDAAVQVRADPARLRTVLKELLRNAAAHAPAGEALILTVSASGAEVKLQLTNPGPAIPETLSAPGTDRDRGLTLVREALEDMGGSLRMDGVPGRGTRATLMFRGAPSERREP